MSIVAHRSTVAEGGPGRHSVPRDRATWHGVAHSAAPVVVTGGLRAAGGLWQRLTIVTGWTWLVVLGLRAIGAARGAGRLRR